MAALVGTALTRLGRKRPDDLSGIGSRAEVAGYGGVPGGRPPSIRLPAQLGIDAEPSSGRFGPFRVIVVPTGPGAPDGKRGVGVHTVDV